MVKKFSLKEPQKVDILKNDLQLIALGRPF